MQKYWVKVGEKVRGPFTSGKLQQLATNGKLKPTHLVSRDKKRWVTADKISGLSFPLSKASRSVEGAPKGDKKTGGPPASLSRSKKSDAGTNRKKKSRQSQRGSEVNETVIRLLESPRSKLALFLGTALVSLLLLGWRFGPPFNWTPTGDSAGNVHSGTVDEFVSRFQPRGRHGVTYSGVSPGQVEWTGEFQGCENSGLVRIRISDSSPIAVCFVSAQEAIPQWKALTEGTTVRFSAMLSGDVMFDVYEGASVLPSGFKIQSNQIESGGGELHASRPEHQSKPAVTLFVDDLRPLEPVPLTGTALADAFAQHWADHCGAAVTRNADGTIVALAAAAPHRAMIDYDRPGWEQVKMGLNDDSIELLAQLPQLRYMIINSTLVTDKGLQAISTMSSLTDLTLIRGSFSDAGVAHLQRCTALKSLTITRNRDVTDACIDAIAKLPSLTDVDFSDTSVTAAGLAMLQGTPIDSSETNKAPRNFKPTLTGPATLRTVGGYSFGKYATAPGQVVFSPDGSLIASREMFSREIHLWDTSNGQQTHLLEHETGFVFDIAFHPSAPLLFTVGEEQTVRIWNAANGQPQPGYVGHMDRKDLGISAVAVSHDGTLAVSGEGDLTEHVKQVHLWSTADLTTRWKVEVGIPPVKRIRFSPDGQSIAVLTSARLLLLSVQDGSVQWEVAPVDGSGLEFLPDGRQVVCGVPDGFVVLDAATGESQRMLRMKSKRNRGCSISHNGNWIAVNLQHAAASQMAVLNFETGQKIADMSVAGEDASIWDVQFSPISNNLAVARSPNLIEIRELKPVVP